MNGIFFLCSHEISLQCAGCGEIPCCSWLAQIGRKALGGRFGLRRRSFLDGEFDWQWCIPLEDVAGSALRRAQGTQLFNHLFKQLGHSLPSLGRFSACTCPPWISLLFYSESELSKSQNPYRLCKARDTVWKRTPYQMSKIVAEFLELGIERREHKHTHIP